MWPRVEQQVRRNRLVLAAILIAIPLIAVASPPVPGLHAMGGACNASPENKCCSCGEEGGAPFCDTGAYIGAVECDGGYCPTNPHCVFRIE